MMNSVVEEIGQEQTRMERETLAHLLAVQQVIGPSKKEKFSLLVADQLRTACLGTACGVTPGCAVTGQE
jgi:hypothetical protein